MLPKTSQKVQMKKMLGFTLTIFLIIAGMIALMFFAVKIFLRGMLTATVVPQNYTKTVRTGGELEARYLAPGDCGVGYLECAAPEEWGKFVVYYPKELEQSEKRYPAVVFVNGTGIYPSRYSALFEHMASWGFIVLGNEDPNTCTGESSDATLTYLLNADTDSDSIFFHKVDTENIGISGHSQGSVGVFNAITDQEHSDLYQCAVSLSPTEEELAVALEMPYDPSKTRIPVMVLAGTKNDVISLEKMQLMYDRIDAPKVMARKSLEGHGEMLYCADGYVTAWFMWHLQGDEEAAKAFCGEDAELLKNGLYQDQWIGLGKADVNGAD